MMSFQFKTSIALVILSFVLGLCTSFLFNGCGGYSKKTASIITTKELKKEVDNKQVSYQAEIEKLQSENIELQQQLEATQGLLDQTKRVAKQKEIKINKLIKPKGYPAKDLLRKVNVPVSETNTSECDSLIQEVSEYMDTNKFKDSLYESKIATQDSIISVKDQVIDKDKKLQTDLKTSFDKSLEQQSLLANENTSLKKQFKRQKIKQKVITIGLIIISGIGTNYLLHH